MRRYCFVHLFFVVYWLWTVFVVVQSIEKKIIFLREMEKGIFLLQWGLNGFGEVYENNARSGRGHCCRRRPDE